MTNFLPILQWSSRQAPTYSLTMALNLGGLWEYLAGWGCCGPGVVNIRCSSPAPTIVWACGGYGPDPIYSKTTNIN